MGIEPLVLGNPKRQRGTVNIDCPSLTLFEVALFTSPEGVILIAGAVRHRLIESLATGSPEGDTIIPLKICVALRAKAFDSSVIRCLTAPASPVSPSGLK